MDFSVVRLDPLRTSERHVEQLVDFVLSTGYFQFAAMGNTRGVFYRDQFRDDIVRPYLSHTWVAIDSAGQLGGCYVCSTRAEADRLGGTEAWRQGDPTMDAAFRVLDEFAETQPPDGHFLHTFAVRPDLRGRPLSALPQDRSLAARLYDHLLQEGPLRDSAHGATLLTWDSHRAAVAFYQRRGAFEIGRADLTGTLFGDVLLTLRIRIRTSGDEAQSESA
jgi:GNAT superfamily N-acetyltransferase